MLGSSGHAGMQNGSLAWYRYKIRMADGVSASILEISTGQLRRMNTQMPVAETLINAAAGHKMMSFMDGNAGYNQIFMAPEDVNKTAFRVPGAVGLFEYLVMTFRLKKAGATYQRAMNYIFHDLIGKLVEIYIDDVVVNSKSAGGHLEDLRQVLERTEGLGSK